MASASGPPAGGTGPAAGCAPAPGPAPRGARPRNCVDSPGDSACTSGGNAPGPTGGMYCVAPSAATGGMYWVAPSSAGGSGAA